VSRVAPDLGNTKRKYIIIIFLQKVEKQFSVIFYSILLSFLTGCLLHFCHDPFTSCCPFNEFSIIFSISKEGALVNNVLNFVAATAHEPQEKRHKNGKKLHNNQKKKKKCKKERKILILRLL
jgi:hypothetical protein